MTPTDSPAQTWRDFVDHLTSEQVIRLAGFERNNPDTAETRAAVLDVAQEWSAANLASDAVFGGVPVPAGAIEVGSPSRDEDGLWQRPFRGTTRTVAGFDVYVEGTQTPSGAAHRWIAVDAESATAAGGTLTVELARALAAALIEAADEVSTLQARNLYPVDTTTRRCCGGVGAHARECEWSL